MGELEIEVRRGRSGALVALSGPVDLSGAARLREALERAPAQLVVVVDFTRVTFLPDVVVGVLAEEIRGHQHRLLLRGLRQHHLRLLQYLRLELDERGQLVPLAQGQASP